MKKLAALLALAAWLVSIPGQARADSVKAPGDPKTALVIIDVQLFYFKGGAVPLENPEAAAKNAGKLLDKFRRQGQMVVHVGHNAKTGASFHSEVKPRKGETVIFKDEVNAFVGTDLLGHLKRHQIKRLVFAGMQTHMCLEAAVRAARDLGFECIVVHDACATRALSFGKSTVSAEDVHLATLSTLDRTYAKVIDTETFLKTY